MVWIAAIAAGAAALGSAAISSSAASSAADAQSGAANNATAAQLQMFNQTQQNEWPFITAGTGTANNLQNILQSGAGQTPGNPILQLLGIGAGGGAGVQAPPGTFQSSPGYQFQLNQGLNAVTNAAAGKGGLGGNTLKALTTYGTGLANQDWYNYLNAVSGGYGNLVGSLQNLSALGQNAAGNLGTNATNVGSQIGGNITGAGNAAASGIVGSSNAWSGLLGSSATNNLIASLANGGGGGSIGQGLGNVFNGYSWDGMASGNTLTNLSNQAANNGSTAI